MKKLLLAILAAALLSSPALADWTGKDASGTTITFKNSGVCSSVVCVPIAQPVDSTGAAFGVTGNPIFMSFGTGVTLPAFAATPTVNLGTLNGAATAAKQPALGTAGTPSTDVITIQGAASMTPVAQNLTQIGGAAPSATNPLWTATAEATVSAGNTLNAVVANTTGTSVPVTGYGAALVDVNCSVTCSGGTAVQFQASDVVGFQAVGAMPVAGGSAMVTSVVNQVGAAMFCIPNMGYTNMRANVASYSAGTISVTITPINAASCDVAQVANAVAPGQAAMAASQPVVLASNQAVGDPCTFQAKSFAPFSLTASGQVITGTSSKKTYICSINLITATAQNIALVEGTGTTCATNVFGLAGGTTAATGWNFAANAGLAPGAGNGTIFFGSGDANATAANTCLLLSGTGQTSGSIGYIQQ